MIDLRKWTQIILTVIVFLFIVPTVSAEENKIESIHIDIELHDNGSATIQETRQMETYEDTELYIELKNLQDSELLDFQVEGFTEEPNWNIEDSFAEKANEYGVIETDDGYELAWGITEYGTPEYHLSYSLSNLVRGLEDGDALLWNFDTFLSIPTDRMTLEISAPFPLEEELLEYYGFGFEGPMEVQEGSLRWTGYGLDDRNDITVLMQFPAGTFQTATQVDMTLAEQREMATEGSSYNEEGPMPLWAIVLISAVGVLGIGAAAGGTAYGIRGRNIRKANNHFYPMEMIKENQGKMSQNPPKMEADIGKYSAILSKVSVAGGGFSEYFFAYLLLWSLEDRIQIETSERDRFIFGPKTEAKLFIRNFEEAVKINQLSFSEYIDLFEMGESTLEEVMWSILVEAANYEGEVEGKEIEKWSTDNGSEVAELVQMMEVVSLEWLEENDYLKVYKVKEWGVSFTVNELTKKGHTLATSFVQYDNFIKDIKEVSLADYAQWHELIVWAALFGRAEKTVEHLEEFHPETWGYLVDTYPSYGYYHGYHYFYTSHTTGLSAGGYGGSGAGGMSSGGGGGGAGGGGGGGSR